MNSPATLWCEQAWVDGEVRAGVEIAIVDGRFDRVSAGVASPSAGSTALRGFSVPGFANAHSHVFHRALRGRSQAGSAPGSFWTWRELMYAVAGRLDPDRMFRLARATYCEMVQAGFTAVGEFHYVHHRPDGTPYDDPNAMGTAVLAAAAEAGIRITLLDTLYLHGGLDGGGHVALGATQQRFGDASAGAWVERVDTIALGDRQRLGAAIHSVRAVDPAAMETVAGWAAATGAPVHAHVSEQPAENEGCLAALGSSPMQVLHDAGALGGRFTAVHATHVDDVDIGLLAASGATVCLCPTTERDLADGIGPTDRLVGAGVPIALGTDSHAVVDPFEEARSMELQERLRSGRRGTHDAERLLGAATSAGHRALGWDDAGQIAVGARADLVTISLDSVRMAGAATDSLLQTTIFAASTGDVTDVVIDGRHVVSNGRHVEIDVVGELHAAVASVSGGEVTV